ncbi:MAG TPA: microviridin/marinostatin family tricyclic proteinase inhibitor [Myxococcota bacterium]|nr:microviridin/marinostatin family tricyclic proteinase inhibitor [Myxococcota bacterium]
MNTNDNALPFFLQYLETQVAPTDDTLSTTSGATCDWRNQETQTAWGCIIDTKKYPSDQDEVRF